MARARRSILLLALLLLPGAAAGQAVTSSPGPDRIAVTIYRDPNRDAASGMELRWLDGYALISETRRVAIPAGDGEIRFEGVAGGILPESAIVTGLPDGVVEKNQDAYLLSPGSLLDRSLGRRVHIRRTSAATGEVREQEAVIRTGADGAVVLQTPEGVEALRCSGLAETIVYDRIPEGLSAKPTLSVRTRSGHAATATVTLSYLASGFDWQANYIATLSPTGDRLDLFAWVTLANGDETGFRDAATQTVAGRPKREQGRNAPPRAVPLYLRCWPAGTTSDITAEGQGDGYPPPPPPAPAAPMMEGAADSIVVTGSRVSRKAIQEDLGDLKLYRIPEPVTIAANSQKQVAMLENPGVKVRTLYRQRLFAPSPAEQSGRVSRVLVTRNRSAEGLGLPLPAGQVVLFGAGRERPVLLGEGFLDDKAVGEDVEIEFGEAQGIVSRATKISEDPKGSDWVVNVTNDHARPVRFEAEIEEGGYTVASKARLLRRDGRPLWSVAIPANSSASLRYRVTSR